MFLFTVYNLTPILNFPLFNLHFPSSAFPCNNSRKNRGEGGHYSKIGANQKRTIGGKKVEADTSLRLWLNGLCSSVMWQNIFTHSSLYFVSTTKAMKIKFYILCTYRHFFTIKLRLLIHISICFGLVQKKTLIILCCIILHVHKLSVSLVTFPC